MTSEEENKGAKHRTSAITKRLFIGHLEESVDSVFLLCILEQHTRAE